MKKHLLWENNNRDHIEILFNVFYNEFKDEIPINKEIYNKFCLFLYKNSDEQGKRYFG